MTSDQGPQPQRSLLAGVRNLLEDATMTFRGTAFEPTLRDLAARLDQPLRVAIAGRVKAGKSTLLNALVGERVAATDAGECTRVVTWYSDGVGYRVWLHPHKGQPRQVPFTREGGETSFELGGYRVEDLAYARVEFPSRRLQRMTLIDTPGIASLSTETSDRTHRFLAHGTPAVGSADAVLYLMRHLHSSDVHFLEAFHDRAFIGTAPVNAIGVLSRADEIGAGRTDATALARSVAQRHRRDPRVRALVQTVVPVAGLLGQTAATLREDEFAALRQIAGEEAGVVEDLLLSADRFAAEHRTVQVDAGQRRALLDRCGIFGVRVSIALIQAGHVRTATELADDLRQRSGLPELESVLLSQFAERGTVIKAYQALQAVEEAVSQSSRSGSPRLRRTVEEILASAHEFEELRLLNDLRTGAFNLDDERRERMEVLLGASGGALRTRLGLPADAPTEDAYHALLTELDRWAQLSESPFADRPMQRAATVLRRTCEGMLIGPEFRELLRS
ncbi:MAG TPA: dynamin family protein [Euzebyales bacterium]|nr:dynamin family protein [Euzebyales bacterium]